MKPSLKKLPHSNSSKQVCLSPHLKDCSPKSIRNKSQNKSRSRSRSKNKNEFNEKEYNENCKIRDVINKVLNIQIDDKIHFVLLKNRLMTAVQSHIQITKDGLKAKDEIGKKVFQNGRFWIKCSHIFETNPHFHLNTFLSSLKRRYLKMVVYHKSQLEEFLFKMGMGVENEPKTSEQYLGNSVGTCNKLHDEIKNIQNQQQWVVEEDSDASVIVTKYNLDGEQIKQNTDSSNKKPTNQHGRQEEKKVSDNIASQNLVINKEGRAGLSEKKRVSFNFTEDMQSNDIVYPTFNDYQNKCYVDEAQQPSKSTGPILKPILKPRRVFFKTEQRLLTFEQKVGLAMNQVFLECQFQDLKNLYIIGIVQKDFLKKGKYAILLCRQKEQQMSMNNKDGLYVFPIANQLDAEFLKQVKARYKKVKGWIRNENKVDITQYWQNNLQEIMA